MVALKTRTSILAVVVGLGGAAPQVALAQSDPGTAGPHTVRFLEYGSFTETETFAGHPNETRAEAYYPDLQSGGPFPIVFFVHGRNFTCWNSQGNTVVAWPCPTTISPTMHPYLNYQGYRDIAHRLASQGIIAVSISANGLSSATITNDAYQQLIEYHLDHWRATNADTFPGAWLNKINFARVGLVGHSRGGEGVMDYAAENPRNVAAVMGIAPTGGGTLAPINSAPLALLLGYCDGDTEDLNGTGYVDLARYSSVADANPKYTFLGLGANHSYFNRFWTPHTEGGPIILSPPEIGPEEWELLDPNEDEWEANYGSDSHCTGNSRLSGAEQRGLGLAYTTAFFRTHLLGQTQYQSILRGDALPPPSAMTQEAYVGYLSGASDQSEINRYTDPLGTNTTWTSGVNASICSGSSSAATACQPSLSDMMSHFVGTRLSALRVSWNTPNQSLSNAVPASRRNVSDFGMLQFRVAVNHTATTFNPVNSDRTFSIQLQDGTTSQSVPVSDYSDVLYFPPGDAGHRKNVMNTVRIPLSAFGNLDHTNITSVNFVFNGSSTGSLLISDLVFADRSISAAEIWHAASVPFLL